MVTSIHHVGIAVKSLSQAYGFWRDTLGLPLLREATVEEQGVRAALLAAGDSEIELLEPLGAESPVGKFLAQRGEGLHHLCFKTADVAGDLNALAVQERRAARHRASRGARRAGSRFSIRTPVTACWSSSPLPRPERLTRSRRCASSDS